MRLNTVLAVVALCGLCGLCGPWGSVAHAGKPVPSSPLKAYKGPEGELIVLVEANDSKEMLVHFKNVGGDLEGKTVLYLLEDRGPDDKTVYINKKRGSKSYRSIMLVRAADNGWEFFHPTKASVHFSIRYSEEASSTIKIDEVLGAYKP